MIKQGPLGRAPTIQEIRSEYARIQTVHRQELAPKFPAWAHALLEEFPMEIVVDDGSLSRNASLYYQRPIQANNWSAKFFEPVPDLAVYNWSSIPRREKHEGPFGHHIQFITQMREERLLGYLRTIAMHPFATESYATYTELLGDRDRWQRAAAAITALHEAEFTEVDYMWNAAGRSAGQLRQRQLARYGGSVAARLRAEQDPMNYVVYSLGRKKFQQMRAAAERELDADGFPEAEFHELVLREGPLLPAQLKKRVEAWTRAKRAGITIPFAGPEKGDPWCDKHMLGELNEVTFR